VVANDFTHPAFATDETTLIVSSQSEPSSVLRLGSWADGLPLRRSTGDVWRSSRRDPEIEIVGGSRHPARERFVRSIPLAVRRHIAPIRSRQVTLLWLARCCEGALDLLASAPVLAWLLACHLADEFDADYGTLLLRRTRAAMLSAIVGRRVSDAAVRLLAKYVPGWTEAEERTLHRLLAEPELVAWCGHEPRLDAAAVAALVRHRHLCGARFLRVALRAGGADAVAARADAIIKLGREMGRADAERVVMTCASPEKLDTLGERWAKERLAARRKQTLLGALAMGALADFGPPPDPGTDAIIPITRAADLIAEGEEMGHCASDLLEDALAGRVYVYRVLAPERATLSVHVADILYPKQLRGLRNAPVKRATKDAVRAWLRAPRVAGDVVGPRTVGIDAPSLRAENGSGSLTVPFAGEGGGRR
jgi:hypothetical protein